MIGISEAKRYLNKLVSSGEKTIITKNNKPISAIVPYDEYIKFIRLQREQEDLAAIKRADEYFAGTRETVNQEELENLIGLKK